MAEEIKIDGVKKTSYGYEIDGHRVYKTDKLWTHTVDRMGTWDKKLSREEFAKKNTTRLKRITKKEKLYYAIAVLVDMGFDKEIIDMYDAQIVMNELTDGLDFLKNI
ncbi:hypothetical protein D3C81_198730 [compost metagenome]